MMPPVPMQSDRKVSIPLYVAAHFGKSLWWNGSELFLAFYLTEHMRLAPLVAAAAIAIGLMAGAAFDIVIAHRAARVTSLQDAGRLQLIGAALSFAALLLLIVALRVDGSGRVAIVVAANLGYRFAYTLYDLPQNCLLSLIDWTEDQRRRAASGRTVASAAAMLIMAILVSLDRPLSDGTDHLMVAGATAMVALGSSVALWRQTRLVRRNAATPTKVAVIGSGMGFAWPLGLMAIVCLTVPAFLKLTPYLTSYSQGAGGSLPLVIVAAATAGSQPVWLFVLRHDGERRAGLLAALLLAAASALTAKLWVAALLIGMASGGLATIIWSSFAIIVADRALASTAPAFAWLTATAKLALAVAAIGIGAILSSADYRHDGAGLLPFMAGLILIGGIATGLYTLMTARIRPGMRAGSA